MPRNVRCLVLTLFAVASLLTLWPAEALAQRGRGRGAGVARPAPAARVHGRPIYYRPYSYRPYYYRPYFYRSYFYRPYFYDPFAWGGWGWYPYPFAGGWGYAYEYERASGARLMVTPRETEVYVDGAFVGLVDDFDGFSQRLRLEPGEHEIELYLPGYRSIRQKVLFRPGGDVKIRHAMEKLGPGEPEPEKPAVQAQPVLPAPRPSREPFEPSSREPGTGPARAEGFGQLAVRVQPSDALVLIDGERWDAPAGERLVVELADGPHRLEVQREGHVSYSAEVAVRSGETTTVNVSLPRR